MAKTSHDLKTCFGVTRDAVTTQINLFAKQGGFELSGDLFFGPDNGLLGSGREAYRQILTVTGDAPAFEVACLHLAALPDGENWHLYREYPQAKDSALWTRKL